MANVTRIGSITVAPTPPDCPFTGDEWWNTVSGQLFVYYDDGNTRQWVIANRSTSGGSSSGSARVTTDDVPPSNPKDGDLWWDSTLGKLFVWYDDANSSQWVPATPTGAASPPAVYNAINARFFGAICDGVTDDSAALNAALASVIASGSELYLPGVCRCLSDVPTVHQAKLVGPGGIQLTSARIWLATPSVRTAFGARQTLYVDPTGSDTNSGLGPTFPLKTMPGVETVLSRYGNLVGHWGIQLAAGEYTDGVQFYGISNKGSAPLYIDGPAVASVWDNTAPPADADVTGGSVPSAIFRPTVPNRNGAFVALDFQQDLHVVVTNVKFRDWGLGTGAGNANYCALRVDYRGTLFANNCHIWNCGSGITCRDFSYLNIQGGIIHGCRSGIYVVAAARYQTGYGATVPGDTKAGLVRQCIFGLDVWEDATGHADFTIFEDNGTQVYLRRKAHAAINGITLRNTGAFGPSIGITVTENSVAGIGTNMVWTGVHTPRLQRSSGGIDTRYASQQFATELMAWATPNQTTVGAATLTVATLAVPALEFTYYPQQISVRAALTLNNLLSTVSLTIRCNGAFMASITIPLVASLRTGEYEIFITPTDALNQLCEISEISSNVNATSVRALRASSVSAIDFSIAQSLTVSANCANAADAVTVLKCEIFRRG